jgi:hypothetical protein
MGSNRAGPQLTADEVAAIAARLEAVPLAAEREGECVPAVAKSGLMPRAAALVLRQRRLSMRFGFAGLLVVTTVAVFAGCGGSTSSSTANSTGSGASRNTTIGTPVSAHPGCGTYCQQAGAPAGNAPPGYPCPQNGCLSCPPTHCASLLTTSATASGGVVTVKLRCQLMSSCQGAFLLCLPETLCTLGPTRQGAGGRLAGSDFTLGPDQTVDVPVALTGLGEQLASLPAGFDSDVLIDLRNYGIIQAGPGAGFDSSQSPSGAQIRLRTTDPGYTPPGGALASCGGAILVGANTTCGFAKAVKDAYLRNLGNSNSNSVNVDVMASSPVTHLTYTMHCVGESPTVCTGGIGARVIWY